METPKLIQQGEADWQINKPDLARSIRGHPAIFLDRDGTLNIEIGGVRHPQDLELIPGVAEALIALRNSGFYLVVVTNQSIIARGQASEDDVAAVHRRLESELGKAGAHLDGIYVCPHHPDIGLPGERADLKIVCDCRKPAIGLVERACRDLSIDRSASWMIGDQTRDVEMARRAGLRSILLLTGAAGRDGQFACAADHVAPDLKHAAAFILSEREAQRA
jgi:D,D-heptose 1,7-bisphosphate phosphatase